MLVKELKEQLNNYNDEHIIILQLDGEGEDYAPLSTIWTGIYVPETEYYGEIINDEDIIKGGDNCIILCPEY